MEIIQSYVLEANIAKMIINDANVLGENIIKLISSLVEISSERWKHSNAERLKELEERHFELFDKYYFGDSQDIIRIYEEEISRELVMLRINKFLEVSAALCDYYERHECLENVMDFLIKCPKFMGSNDIFRTTVIRKCNEYNSVYEFINKEKIHKMNECINLITKY